MNDGDVDGEREGGETDRHAEIGDENHRGKTPTDKTNKNPYTRNEWIRPGVKDGDVGGEGQTDRQT